MAINPIDIESLKPEDVVITSTPQQRKEDKPAEEKPAEEKPKDEKPKEEKPEGDGKEVQVPAKPGEAEVPAEEREEGKEGEPEAEFDWEAFSENVGIELDSDDAVIESLKELAEYKNLSPALQKAIEIEKAQGDVALYFKTIANDPKDLSDRDALWEQYVTENPKRVAGNPKFARLDFDRKLDKEYELLTKYEKLSASEQEEFLAEHKADIDYLKEKRKFDADTARATLQETRDGMTFAPVKTGQVDEKQEQEMIKAHESGYKKAISEFDVVALKVGKDFEFNVGLTDSNKKIATEWMKQPEKLLNELGFSKGKIDYDTLAGWA